MRVDSRHAKSCGIRATHGRTECAHASTQPNRDSERGAGIASRLASARSGGAVTAAPTVPAYGAKMAAAGSHPQPRVPPRPALSAPLCLSPRPCRAAAISPRSPRRRCGRAARPFASAFAPAPAPRKGMAFGPRRGHAAQRRGSPARSHVHGGVPRERPRSSALLAASWHRLMASGMTSAVVPKAMPLLVVERAEK